MLENQREILHALLNGKEKSYCKENFLFYFNLEIMLVEKILQNVPFLVDCFFKKDPTIKIKTKDGNN